MATSTSSKNPQKIIENYIIIWLDPKLNFSKEKNQELICQLRSVVNTVETFTDFDECIKFIEQMKTEKIFLIISDCFTTQITSLKNQFPQLISIYIFCNEHSKSDDNNIQAYKKGKSIYTQMKSLCIELKKEVRQLNNDNVPISIISASSTTNLNELNPEFMYLQFLKENLLAMKYNHDMEIQQLVDHFRSIYKENEKETRIINELEENYHEDLAIWWYTRNSFMYKELNDALRNFDLDVLIKMGFFIRDLHEQIEKLHSKSDVVKKRFNVYRGQGMDNAKFDKLIKDGNGSLLSFNNFFSTSTDESTAKDFACENQCDPKKKAILFQIEIDTSQSSVPFAPIKGLSYFPLENEILFSMGTVFRIGDIKEIETNLYKVNLSSTSDRDPLLKRLTEHMRISIGGGNEWRRLGQLMIKVGQFDKAKDIFKMLLKTVDLDDKAENAFLHNQLGYILKQKNELKDAFTQYEEALRINRTYMSDTDSRLSSIYSNIGGILKKLGDANGALKYYELVLKIDLAAAKPNQLEIAIDHNNIGSVLDDLGKYSEALKSYEEALNIKLAHLPPHHPSLASTYSNVGLIHRKMGDCTTALKFYEETLKIQQKSLPSNHPSLVVTHGKLASTLEDLRQFDKAIHHARQAADIANKAYGSSDPETEKRQKYLRELQQKL